MSLARETRRGFFLKARLGVNGSQNALKSFGTSARWAGDFTAVAVVIGRSPERKGAKNSGANNGGGACFCPV